MSLKYEPSSEPLHISAGIEYLDFVARGEEDDDDEEEGREDVYKPRERWTYRGTSLIRNRPPLGPYSSPMTRALWWT